MLAILVILNSLQDAYQSGVNIYYDDIIKINIMVNNIMVKNRHIIIILLNKYYGK